MEKIKLNNGVEMPILGLGTYKAADNPEACANIVKAAIESGYRLIDTAQGYGNESYVGDGIIRSGLAREEIFLVTKVDFKRYEDAYASVEESLAKLKTEYLDLVLLHWPFGNTYAAWRDLEKLYAEGRIRAIGVSNFTPDRLLDIIHYNKVAPAVNQIETNLICQQKDAREWLDRCKVQHMSYAPFGQGRMEEIYQDATLLNIASRYGKSVRQVVLRFLVQQGIVVIPKTSNPERLKENFDVFDFRLSEEDMALLLSFDRNAPLIGTPQDPNKVLASFSW